MVLQWPSLGVPLDSLIRLTRPGKLYVVDLLADHINHSVVGDLSSAVQLACFPDNGSGSNHLLALPSIHWEEVSLSKWNASHWETNTSAQH